MILQHQTRNAPMVVGLIALLLFAPGCLFSPDEGGDKKDTNTREPTRDSVAGAIDLYAFVWKFQRGDLYQQLLHDQYEYFPQSDDIDDFPWIVNQSWGRTDELGMAVNMFDDNFISAETDNAIDEIQMELAITNERAVPEGIEVTTSATIQVLWAAETGARSDVRFVFTVVPDPDEPSLFQILRQDELPAF